MAFDDRIVRVSIEVRGQLHVYEGMAIIATGNKYDTPQKNDCTIRIANLAKDVRDYIVTATSPFNPDATKKKLILEVGRKSTGTFVLFSGEIVSALVTQPPDIWLELKCLTGSFDSGNVVSNSQPANTNLSTIAKQVADSMGLTLLFEATDKKISSFSYTGGASGQIQKLAEAGGVNAYADNDKLVVKNRNTPLANSVRLIDIDSGMVGVPNFSEKGVKVTYLIAGETHLGGTIKIDSKINPSVSGAYVVYKLGFNVTSRDVPFYYTAEGARPS